VQADLIVLADGANNTAQGKLNILGEFNLIWGRQLPITWPLMVLVLRLECSSAEGPVHTLNLRFVNEDGEIVSPNLEVQLNLGQPFRPGMPHRGQLILPIGNARFKSFGTYELEVLVNNQRIGARPLHVLDARERPGAAGA
jgi:hypothetical protein